MVSARKVIATSLSLFVVVSLAIERPVQAQYNDVVPVYGPLMLAMESSYKKWVAGPLKGSVPDPSGFQAAVDASADPFKIAFQATKDHTVAPAQYSVPASQVTDPSWPEVPSSYKPNFPKGPITLSGTYVRAYDAAYKLHLTYEAFYGDGYAYQNSPGAGVIFSTLPANNKPLVGFEQKFVPKTPPYVAGCWKIQYYLVDPQTFEAAKTHIGCPG
jgi:hypothetical protein